jgi:hypothetical protein
MSRRAFRAGLMIIALGLAVAPAAADDDVVLTFACDLAHAADSPAATPDWGDAFTVTVPFGEGESLALLDPESGKVRATIHASDVLAGTLRLPQETATLVWTRAMSRRAPLVGQAARSDGHLVVLALAAPRGGSGARALQLFDTASARAWNGQCRQAP